MKNNFGFVLVNPQLGENIGSCARAIKNFGFSNLNLVNPKLGWPNTKARMTSVGAYDIVKKAKLFQNTESAVKQYDIVISTTARKRDINKKHISLNAFSKIINKYKKKKIGILFGPESSGLSNSDLAYSNYALQIPTFKFFSSINISHAVIIVCYEIFKNLNENKLKKDLTKIDIAPKKKIIELIKHLTLLLTSNNFFKPDEKKHSMLLNINNLFHRFEPSEKEVRILASIISSLGKKK